MYCTNCGHRNPEGANFCGTCGEPIRPEEAEDTTVTFNLETEGEGEEEFSIPFDELEEGKAIIVVRRGPNAGTKFFLDKDTVTCGRNPSSDIFLDDVTVSRKHAEIRREGSSFQLVDVGSLNGAFVNRRRVETSPLVNGDEVQIGKFKLVFFTAGAFGA
ncbi:MAG: FHA domain-containing protein [Actinomycetota bacterium]